MNIRAARRESDVGDAASLPLHGGCIRAAGPMRMFQCSLLEKRCLLPVVSLADGAPVLTAWRNG
jgi:hypothetical protein